MEEEQLSFDLVQSRGYLPHRVYAATHMVTWRLADSIPPKIFHEVIGGLIEKARRRSRKPIDELALRRRLVELYADRGYGACWLRDEMIGALVEGTLRCFDGVRYDLGAWVLMPNHVHVIVTVRPNRTLPGILHSWKSYTAAAANRLLGRRGPFWFREYFDREIRDEDHLASAMRYIDLNPVNARLCRTPEEWRFSSAWHRARRR